MPACAHARQGGSEGRGCVQDVDKPENFPQRKPNTPEDKAVVRDAQDGVQAWFRGGEATRVVGEGLSAFQRSLVYTMLRGLKLGGGGWRGFYFEKAGEWPNEGILLTRATQEESAAHDVEVRAAKIRAIKARPCPPLRPEVMSLCIPLCGVK